ncbi:MAG: twin-arginine translocase subunit TatC [Thaumarchaeota archaeon]|nr:twin-arginine translocase subunit TatC [Nitrososphaerota archaeon]
MREHLDELKHRMKVALISFAILLGVFLLAPAEPRNALNFTGTYVPFVAFFLARVKLDLLPAGWTLIANHLNEPLEVYIIASVMLAAIFNAPIFAYETIKFVSPALTEKEKGVLYPFVTSSSVLFTVGILFGYFFLAKFLFIALGPFFITAQATPFIDVSDFYFVVFLVIGMSGIAFTTPVYVFILVRFRIISPQTFRKNRVIIWVVTYIATALITPDGGPLLDLILFVPIILLLELAVWLAARSLRNIDQAAAPTADACRYCGAKLNGKFFCPNCGKAAN